RRLTAEYSKAAARLRSSPNTKRVSTLTTRFRSRVLCTVAYTSQSGNRVLASRSVLLVGTDTGSAYTAVIADAYAGYSSDVIRLMGRPSVRSRNSWTTCRAWASIRL